MDLISAACFYKFLFEVFSFPLIQQKNFKWRSYLVENEFMSSIAYSFVSHTVVILLCIGLLRLRIYIRLFIWILKFYFSIMMYPKTSLMVRMWDNWVNIENLYTIFQSSQIFQISQHEIIIEYDNIFNQICRNSKYSWFLTSSLIISQTWKSFF